jgi:hypothetical protein
MLPSFAGSGIPASQDQAIVLTAAYHDICVQVVGCSGRGMCLQDLSGYSLYEKESTCNPNRQHLRFVCEVLILYDSVLVKFEVKMTAAKKNLLCWAICWYETLDLYKRLDLDIFRFCICG